MLLKDLFEMSTDELHATQQDISSVMNETPYKFDVLFKPHFAYERLQGREQAIPPVDVVTAFTKMRNKYCDRIISALDKELEFWGVIKYHRKRLNIVFAVTQSLQTGKYIIRCVTIMKKDCNSFSSDDYRRSVDLPV